MALAQCRSGMRAGLRPRALACARRSPTTPVVFLLHDYRYFCSVASGDLGGRVGPHGSAKCGRPSSRALVRNKPTIYSPVDLAEHDVLRANNGDDVSQHVALGHKVAELNSRKVLKVEQTHPFNGYTKRKL